VISIPSGTSADPIPQATREQFSEGTLRSWEASSFNGLFEMHLAQDTQSGVQQEVLAKQSESSNRGNSTQQYAQFETSGHDSGARSSISDPNAVNEIESWGVDFDAMKSTAASVVATFIDTTAPEEVQNTVGDIASSAIGDEPLAQGYEPSVAQMPLQRATLVSGADGAEIYVRDPALDTESGLAFVRAASQLLLEHRLSLGRVKINGHAVVPTDEERRDLPPASS